MRLQTTVIRGNGLTASIDIHMVDTFDLRDEKTAIAHMVHNETTHKT